jgi:hypothetical protein
VFLLVLTPEAWESKWAQDELELAIATRRRILPVLLRNTQVSGFLLTTHLTTQWITVIGEEPQAAARGLALTLEALPAPSTTDSKQTLQFSAHYPSTISVEEWTTLLVYTYVAEALAQVQADVATFTTPCSAPTEVQAQSERAVANGVELTVEPHIEGVTFSPKSDPFIWRGVWRRSLFRCKSGGALDGREQKGWINICAAPMVPIARIDIAYSFRVNKQERLAIDPPRGMVVTSNCFDRVFICYSHRDRVAFDQACEEYQYFRITVYTDEQLEAGADFEDELATMIAKANLFHLLWSRHSARSPDCHKEILFALRREPTERFIKP